MGHIIHHDDSPLLKQPGVQMATKSLATSNNPKTSGTIGVKTMSMGQDARPPRGAMVSSQITS